MNVGFVKAEELFCHEHSILNWLCVRLHSHDDEGLLGTLFLENLQPAIQIVPERFEQFIITFFHQGITCSGLEIIFYPLASLFAQTYHQRTWSGDQRNHRARLHIYSVNGLEITVLLSLCTVDLGGPSVFSVFDEHGHIPLGHLEHFASASRKIENIISEYNWICLDSSPKAW